MKMTDLSNLTVSDAGIAFDNVETCYRPTPESDLMSVDMAIAHGLRLATPVGIETLPLDQAIGRILAEPVRARFPQPAFNNSAMDGYAIRLKDMSGPGPWRLKVTGRIAAGDAGDLECQEGAIRIFTGAPVPADYDAVIMQEHVERQGSWIIVHETPRLGLNIRKMGEDIRPGCRVLEPGVDLSPARMAIAASTGLASITCFKKVVVGIFSTGSELCQPGETLSAGQIYNSNRYMLKALLDHPFTEVVDLGALPDEPSELTAGLQSICHRADVVISTGGVSTGEEDHMPRVVRQLGGHLSVLSVAMKPGKPVSIGTIGKAVYVGLPGNPVAAFVSYELIVRKIIEKRAGRVTDIGRMIVTVSGFERRRRPARCEYLPARIVWINDDGVPVIDMLGHGSSAALLPLAQADVLAVVEKGDGLLREGDRLSCIRLSGN